MRRRAFVAAQLGDLARDDAKERGERAALLAVLDAQGSLTTAARTLGIHKNTVLQQGASCRRAQGPARNGQGRRTARRPTRLRRAGGLGVARLIASLTGARAALDVLAAHWQRAERALLTDTGRS